MDERELRLNSLARFAKSSPMYVLEEHGHCEVPAGCGGVVLRWRNPRDGVPVHIWLYRQDEGTLFLDGAPLPSARPVVSFGEHVLALELTVADPRCTVLMLAACYPPPAGQWVDVRSSAEQDAALSVLSAADGTWRYTASEPDGERWMLTGFDDSLWQEMVAREDRRPPLDPRRDLGKYAFEKLRRLGAAGLGVPDRPGRIWVRRVFEVAEGSPQLRAAGRDDG